jgi:hypothetical protein
MQPHPRRSRQGKTLKIIKHTIIPDKPQPTTSINACRECNDKTRKQHTSIRPTNSTTLKSYDITFKCSTDPRLTSTQFHTTNSNTFCMSIPKFVFSREHHFVLFFDFMQSCAS